MGNGLFYAMTVRDGVITGVHESAQEIAPDIFADNAEFGGDAVVQLGQEKKEYAAGYKLAEYDEDGKLRPILDRINDGLTPVPEGYELVDGELVEITAPAEEAPLSIAEKIEEVEALKAQLNTVQHEKALMQAKINALTETNEMYGDLIQELALVAYQ